MTNRNLRGSVVHSENKFTSSFRHNKQNLSIFRVYLVNRKYFLVCELVCYLIVWQNAKRESVVRIITETRLCGKLAIPRMRGEKLENEHTNAVSTMNVRFCRIPSSGLVTLGSLSLVIFRPSVEFQTAILWIPCCPNSMTSKRKSVRCPL